MWNVLALFTKIDPLKRFNLFPRDLFLRIWAYKGRWLIKKIILSYVKLSFDDNNQEKKSCAFFGTNLFQIFNCIFVPTFFEFVDYLWLPLENLYFRNLWRNHRLGGKSVQCSRMHFFLTKTMNKLIFYKTLRLYIIGRSLRDRNVTVCLQLAQKWNLSTKVWQNLLFLSTLSDFFWCYVKRGWKSRVFSRCKLWFYRFVEKQQYKLLVNPWRFLWKDLEFKTTWWYCCCWQTSWVEYYLQWGQLVSSKQTWPRCWAPEHAHCSFQVAPLCDANQYA